MGVLKEKRKLHKKITRKTKSTWNCCNLCYTCPQWNV